MDKKIPKDLIKKSIVLAGEEAWSAKNAMEVVDWFENNDIIISGIELWQKEGSSPKWVATSNYVPVNSSQSARAAKEFIHRFSDSDGALFNFSW